MSCRTFFLLKKKWKSPLNKSKKSRNVQMFQLDKIFFSPNPLNFLQKFITATRRASTLRVDTHIYRCRKPLLFMFSIRIESIHLNYTITHTAMKSAFRKFSASNCFCSREKRKSGEKSRKGKSPVNSNCLRLFLFDFAIHVCIVLRGKISSFYRFTLKWIENMFQCIGLVFLSLLYLFLDRVDFVFGFKAISINLTSRFFLFFLLLFVCNAELECECLPFLVLFFFAEEIVCEMFFDAKESKKKVDEKAHCGRLRLHTKTSKMKRKSRVKRNDSKKYIVAF